MKKFVLLTTVCVVAAAPAFADRDKTAARTDQSRYSETYYRYDGLAQTTEYVDVQTPDDMKASGKVSRTFNLVNGDRAFVKGETIYLQTADSNQRFLAPTGTYTATNGIALVAESGMLLRTENPPQRYYVDADDNGFEVQKAGRKRAR